MKYLLTIVAALLIGLFSPKAFADVGKSLSLKLSETYSVSPKYLMPVALPAVQSDGGIAVEKSFYYDCKSQFFAVVAIPFGKLTNVFVKGFDMDVSTFGATDTSSSEGGIFATHSFKAADQLVFKAGPGWISGGGLRLFAGFEYKPN